MDPELHARLDGEKGTAELDPEHAREVERWETLIGELRAARRTAPAELERRVMHAVHQAARARRPAPDTVPAQGATERPGSLRRWAGWLVRPFPVRIPPLGYAGAAAVLALLVAQPWDSGAARRIGDQWADRLRRATEAVPRIYVEFTVRAPSARSVAVAGDFSGWEPVHALEDPDNDGIWSGRVPLEPGVHEYMFVLDGTRWMTDPEAPRHADDGFGNRNAVLAIAPPASGA